MTSSEIRLRIFLFQIAIVVAFAVFLAQLWRLQVLQGEQYQQLADTNRFRAVDVDSPRGIIYDRNGELLVRNRPTFDVVIVPAFLPEEPNDQAALFAELSELLKLPITNGGEREVASHNAFYRSFLHHEYTRLPNRQVRNSRSRLLDRSPKGIKDAVYNAPIIAPYQPILIAEDIDPRIAAIIEENRLNLPGVLIETGSEREYLTGGLTSQILGYVGPIPPGLTDQYDSQGYGPNDSVGLVGLEAEYESYLHGSKGLENIEVDVTGRKVRTVGDVEPAEPGNNLTLTIDLELQAFVTQVLEEAIEESGGDSGASIVMNPRNGEILAMVSLPSYDNNLFAQGISAREFGLLSEDENTPLVNKAISGLYPPASTFKIIVASGALEEGTVTPQQEFIDAGVLYLPNKFFPDDASLAQPFYGWARNGLGRMNVVSALAWSSNIYFYQVGGGYEPIGYDGLGRDNLIHYAEMFGYGQPTGIDLPGESDGLIPTAKWKRINYAETWVTGDTYNMSIGQGFVLATPLQVLNAYAALANDGTLYRPYFLKEVRSLQGDLVYKTEPEVIGQLGLSPETLVLVKSGLDAVVDVGTAVEAIQVPGVAVSGKTGTADFCKRYPQCLDQEGRVKDKHAWFVAYAPREDPRVAVITFVYDGGEGSETAAPAVNRILRYYFGIDQLQAAEAIDFDFEAEATGGDFEARLLGADVYPDSLAAVSGFALDNQGDGLANVLVELTVDEHLVGQALTDFNGHFDFSGVDPAWGEMWTVNLIGYPAAESVALTISGGTRYFVEFQMTEVVQELTIDDESG